MSLSNNEILRLVDVTDRKLAAEGIGIKQRSIQVAVNICKEIGVTYQIGGSPDPVIKRINDAHQSLYRKDDVGVGAAHLGLTFFLDVFFISYIPYIYGTVEVNLSEWNDASEIQRRRVADNRADLDRFLFAACDVFDIGCVLANFEGYDQPTEEARRYFRIACFHNQAMAATLRYAFDPRGGLQSSLLCAEMALKAALCQIGWSEDRLKNEVGHNLLKAIKPLSDAGLIGEVELREHIEKLPHLVSSRYNDKTWGRLEVSNIAEAAQSVLAVVARAIGQKSILEQVSW